MSKASESKASVMFQQWKAQKHDIDLGTLDWDTLEALKNKFISERLRLDKEIIALDHSIQNLQWMIDVDGRCPKCGGTLNCDDQCILSCMFCGFEEYSFAHESLIVYRQSFS